MSLKSVVRSRPALALAVVVIAAGVMSSVATAQASTDASLKTLPANYRPMTAVRPLKGPVPQVAPNVPQLKTWTGKVKDGAKTFTFRMVGKNIEKAQANPTTTVTVPVIPLIMKLGTKTFDPTALHAACETDTALNRFVDSPIFDSTTSYNMNGVTEGPTQYVDAFQRANFDKFTGAGGINRGYHVRLNFVIKPAITLNVTGASTVGSGCSLLGIVDISSFDSFVQGTLFPEVDASDGVTPAQFPIFLMRDIVWSDGFNCCIFGYHGAFSNPDFGGALQTYSPTDMELSGQFASDGIQDTSVASHEVAEWVDDPTGTNPTKKWGNIGQVSGCQGNLEVGDPLTGTNVTPNVTLGGFTYHLQELAFFSWFYHQSPSLGSGGKYSNDGTFTTPAPPCP